MGDVIKVLLCDDDPLVRAGLSLMLGGQTQLEVAAEAAHGAEALDLLDEHEVDVVLMDLRMPIMDGIEATRRIVSEHSRTHVLVLTTFDADEYVLRALNAGAAGFLLKDTPPEQIVHAIEQVAAGAPMLSPSITQQLIDRVTSEVPTVPPDTLAVDSLSERELEVAIAIGRGQSNAEIAESLYMSVTTVKAHITKIFTKLDVNNRVQVAIRMHEAGRLD